MDTTDQFQLDADEDYVIVDANPENEEPKDEAELDAARLAQRQKQIAFGKNTAAYKNYIKMVPKHRRKLRGKDADPATPDISLKASKRCWTGMLRKWRRSLHAWDTEPEGTAQPAPANQGHSQQPQQQPPQQPQPQQQERTDGMTGDHQQRRQQPPAQQQQQQRQQQQQPQQPRQRRGAAHPYLQPQQQERHPAPGGSGQRGHGRGAGDGGGWPRDDSRRGVARVTPSKRPHSGGGGGKDDVTRGGGGGVPSQRDTPSKRTRGSEQQVPLPPGKAQEPKSWADQVADAFGDWTE